MKLLIQNTKDDSTKNIPVGNFSWEIFIFGWCLFPYIKYEIWTPLKIYAGLIVFSLILFLIGERLIPFPIDIADFCFSTLSINFILMNVLHSYWAAIGERECLRTHLKNGWTIVNNAKAAKMALVVIGVIDKL